MKAASFFTGIGGFDLGFHQAGIETIFQCENNPFCRRVLRYQSPLLKPEVVCGDIKEIDQEGLEIANEADVWSAGFPCQDLSHLRVKHRKGIQGNRSGLFFAFAQLLRRSLPNFVVLENVPGLLTSGKGCDFAQVLGTLAKLGYGLAWRVLDSQFFGVAQRRRRLFIVGCFGEANTAAKVLFDRLEDANTDEAVKEVETASGGVSPCLLADPSPGFGKLIVYDHQGPRKLTSLERERLQGFPEGWTCPHDFEKVSENDRCRALGNAVTVPVAKWLGERLRRVDE